MALTRAEVLEAIVSRLAAVKEPVVACYDGQVGWRECGLCGAKDGGRAKVHHMVNCPWIAAKRIGGK
jgi:hypothetical protein